MVDKDYIRKFLNGGKQMNYNEQHIKELRDRFKQGTKIKLIKMNDPYPVSPNTIGYVKSVDDGGTIHIQWENGSSLGLIYGTDKFEILEEN